MSTQPPHILLTGFGPFPGFEKNVSCAFARRLAALCQKDLDTFHFVSATLPVSWQAAPDVLSGLLSQFTPVLALHFGVSERARGFVLETAGRNTMKACADADGALPVSDQVIAGCDSQIAATLPVQKIASTLEREAIPVEISDDAGDYLCNAVLFYSLAIAAGHVGSDMPRGYSAGFVHIPTEISYESPGRNGVLIDWPLALRGGRLIVETAITGLTKS